MARAITHEKALERAANLRAMLTAHLNKTEGYVAVSDIRVALKDKLQALKVNDVVLARQLKTMADNKLIKTMRDGKRNLYANADTVTPRSETKVDVKIKPLKSGIVPAYKIDVVKGRKRVRITLDNVMFDIGVVDA